MSAELEARMDKSIAALDQELASIRAGRANPAILNKIVIEYYGSQTPLTQIASVSSPDPRSMIIQPWDASMVNEIEKAILKSDLGLTPNNDGKVIRLNFPPPTEERRLELVKTANKKAEEAKIAVRSIRRDAIDDAKAQKKNNELTEDDLKDLEKEIQNSTDKKIAEIDKILAQKEAEIKEV